MGNVTAPVIGVFDQATGALVGIAPDGSRQTPTQMLTSAQAAAVAFAPITAAQVLTDFGAAIGESRQISDGVDVGARLIWAIPAGGSVAAWCWWLWPQSQYGV
jgi:hypothetical protein